jgi:protein tyrosine phosphatase
MGPNSHSKAHFWQMIWDNKVDIIIMLCPSSNQSLEESIDYWLDYNQKESSRIIVESIIEQVEILPNLI